MVGAEFATETGWELSVAPMVVFSSMTVHLDAVEDRTVSCRSRMVVIIVGFIRDQEWKFRFRDTIYYSEVMWLNLSY